MEGIDEDFEKEQYFEERKNSKETELVKKYFVNESDRKVFADVFDKSTIQAIHTLAKKGNFDVLEYVVNTGKEAHLFRAVDSSGNYKAVKIYTILTSDFKNMEKYIAGDIRFKEVKKGKRELVFAWTRKEYRNLELLMQCRANSPQPIAFRENVLVMEFIGENGNASPILKERGMMENEVGDFYRQVIEFIANAFFSKNLIHADLSEFNILVKGERLFFIDVGQAVLNSHPKAQEFFERDCMNVAKYFSKHGLERTGEDVKEDVKKLKGRFGKK